MQSVRVEAELRKLRDGFIYFLFYVCLLFVFCHRIVSNRSLLVLLDGRKYYCYGYRLSSRCVL